MSPRRSSRARTAQPANPASLAHSASVSSQSSSRDRTRAPLNHEPVRDGHSTEDEPDAPDQSEMNARQTRQRRREQLGEPTEAVVDEVAADDDKVDEEEEVTRCVCRRQEYPGPPIPLSESGRTRQENSAHMNENLPDDAGGLFIQCDTCKVWQHGGCVGIMDEAMSPDNYYCEQCRPHFHKLMTGARAQRYSRFLPVLDPSAIKTTRRPSSAKRESEVRASREAESRSAASKPTPSARFQRATVNSRAAWEEEQMIQRAIEASKANGNHTASNGTRSIKRGRDESEESSTEVKRRKTASQSQSPTRHEPGSLGPESDSESKNRSGNGASKKVRGAVAQAQREKEVRDREKERERERAEAAGRRKGRAERRHADESEPPEDEKDTVTPGAAPLASTQTVAPASAPTKNGSKAAKPTPPVKTTTTGSATPAPAVKRSSRPQRKGRVGRNQYTRDRDAELDKQSPPGSRDSDDATNSGDGHGTLLANGSRPSRPRHINPNRTSMNELRKRAAGILEFISRTQVEMAGEKTPPGAMTPSSGDSSRRSGHSKLSLEVDGEGEGGEESKRETAEQDQGGGDEDRTKVDEAAFGTLQPRDMMDILTRELLVWQKQHGKYGEKTG